MDNGHKITDQMLNEIEKEITAIYKEAHQSAYNKAAEYVKKFAEKDSEMKKKRDAGEITDDEYKAWRKRELMYKSRYKAMEDALARDMTNANKLAASVINGYLPDVYATNYNWGTYKIEQDARIDTNFMIYDRQTVERLIRDNPDLLPIKAGVSVPDDIKWNKKKINGAITQSILLGESIPDIAKRLADVTDMNRKAAIRNARTMTTSAENGGRIDSYKRATDMGIKITQEWMATNDGRTRHEHRLLDGQEVKIGEPFKVDGYEIEFPGDPKAEPFLVYNCRCALVSNFKGFDHKKMDNYIEQKPTSYKEWTEKQKIKIENDALITNVVSNDKDEYINTYPNEFTTKGYVGLSKSESDKFMEEYHNKRLLVKNHANTMVGKKSQRISKALRNGEELDSEDKPFVEKLDKAISSNQLPYDMTLFRGVPAIVFEVNGAFGNLEEMKEPVKRSDYKDISDWIDALNKKIDKQNAYMLEQGKKLIGTTIIDKSFMQVSASSQRNIFVASEVNLQIHAPKGLNAYISDYKEESEIILARETELRIVGAELSKVVLENKNEVTVLQLIAEIVQKE